MKNLVLKEILIENFKGCKQSRHYFGLNTMIFGSNASGKTTVFDALTWLLFNKDSLGNTKFNIRPLDKNGNLVDNVEIKVEATFSIDGKDKILTKVQKQNWSTKRGTSEKELKGNVNSYEADGYPKSEKEFKEIVDGIIKEDVFQMLTNPMYFLSLPWKDQRANLMKFIEDMKDLELALSDVRFSDLIDDLEKASSVEDILKKYQKMLKSWKDKSIELPVRIDELERQKVDVDVAEKELEKNLVKEQLESNLSKQKSQTGVFEKIKEYTEEIAKLQIELNGIVEKANRELCEKKQNVRKRLDSVGNEIHLLERKIARNNEELTSQQNLLNSRLSMIKEVQNEFRELQDRKFDENSLFCKLCGQPLPLTERESLKADYENKRTEELNKITQRGTELNEKIKNGRTVIEQLTKEISEEKEKLETLTDEYNKVLEEEKSIVANENTEQSEEYLTLSKQIEHKKNELSEMSDVDKAKTALKNEEISLRDQILSIEKEISKAETNDQLQERIEELRLEQKEVAQKVADQEKMVFLVEEFIRFKMAKFSKAINQKFDGICFKLFENQINGGLKECCECTINGVPYTSLNNGHRIVAGLKIIKALQELYGVMAPVIVDNAESVNEFNIPTMNCQTILLVVTNEKEIKVEVR